MPRPAESTIIKWARVLSFKVLIAKVQSNQQQQNHMNIGDLKTGECLFHRASIMYSYVRLSIDRCTATYV